MDDYESLSHTKWDCKYQVVFIPKYRRKALYGEGNSSRPSVATKRQYGSTQEPGVLRNPALVRCYAVPR